MIKLPKHMWLKWHDSSSESSVSFASNSFMLLTKLLDLKSNIPTHPQKNMERNGIKNIINNERWERKLKQMERL